MLLYSPAELHRASYKDFVEAVVCRPCGAALRRLRVNEFGRSFCYHTTYFPMVGGSASQSKGEGKGEDDSDGERGARMFIVGAGWLEPLDEEPVLEDTPVLYEGAKFVGATWIDIGFGVPDSLFFR